MPHALRLGYRAFIRGSYAPTSSGRETISGRPFTQPQDRGQMSPEKMRMRLKKAYAAIKPGDLQRHPKVNGRYGNGQWYASADYHSRKQTHGPVCSRMRE